MGLILTSEFLQKGKIYIPQTNLFIISVDAVTAAHPQFRRSLQIKWENAGWNGTGNKQPVAACCPHLIDSERKILEKN